MGVQAWTYVFVGVTFAIYLVIGYLNRVRDTRGFYVAGQGVPAIFNGAATGADWMSAASFISMSGMISFMGYDGAVYLIGWTGGYVLLALLLAPYLRKYGKYTVPDFVGDRYYSGTARVIAAIAAVFISLTYVAGQMRGVGVVFSGFMGVPIWAGVVIGVAIVAFFAVLGGMKGITWTQVAQYFVLILAFLIPAVAISIKLTGNPIPQIAFTTSDIIERLNRIQVELGFAEYTRPFQSKSFIDVLCIATALMVGTAGLPHIIVRFYTVPNVRAARYSAGWALLFIALLYTTAPALAAFARFNLIDSLHGKSLEEVGQLPWVDHWAKTGLLKLDDKDGDGLLELLPDAAQNEITVDRDIIVLATPEVAGLAPWVVGLVA
ncbi:MAG: VC_2705 family sodium/solute symporter, partial [Acidobacteria bacterium]|nr:VC_2705 family sodium/solute symporter [Acidobacteriota bacterium]